MLLLPLSTFTFNPSPSVLGILSFPHHHRHHHHYPSPMVLSGSEFRTLDVIDQ